MNCYLNEFTVKWNFHKVFGYDNQFWAKWLYFVVANGIPNRWVYFPDYINILKLLHFTDKVSNLSLMFKFLDSDNDWELQSSDLVNVSESMPKNCPYAKEFNVLIDYYLETSIMRNQEKEQMMKWARGI